MISNVDLIKNIDNFDFFNDENSIYTKYYNSLKDVNNIQHLIISGKNGIGKKSRFYALLYKLFNNNSIYNIKNKIIDYDNIKINFNYSNYHIEIKLDNYQNNELDTIYKYLKEYSESYNIGYNIPKIIVLFNINKIHNIFQKKIKFLLDYNIKTSRFIFINNNNNNIIKDILSRCIIIRIPVPKYNEIKNIIIKNANKNNIICNDSDINMIIQSSYEEDLDINIKNILDKFQLSFINNNFEIYKFNYVKLLNNIYLILNKKNINLSDLEKLRNITFDLFSNLIDTKDIIKYLLKKILINDKINNDLKLKILDLANDIIININKCHKDIIILENFYISILNILNI